jgi:hypothetical protein
MKTYKFIELPPMGPGETERNGSLYDLVKSIPYFFARSRLPSLKVMNSVFETGMVGGGMSGGVKWEPFTIKDQDYTELANQCKQHDIEIPECPPWISNYSDFQIWEYEIDLGIPAKQHKILADEEEEAAEVLKKAMASGATENEILKLHLEVIDAGNKLVEFLDKHTHT